MKKFNAYLFPVIMLVTALAMASVAAFISVSGLSKLFAGAGVTVLIMTGIIEFSKIVSTTYLHKSPYTRENLKLNIPLTFITVMIMIITSIGVYGFLANGYTVTSGELAKTDGEIALIENKIRSNETKISGLESQKVNSNKRANTLMDLRGQQESRVDSLYKKGWIRTAKKVQVQIDNSNKEITSLMAKVVVSDSLIQVENEKIGEFRNEIISLSNNEVNSELGPLKYISDLTGLSMDNVINYIILILIFIFDPAAVLLLVAANGMLDKAKEELEREENEKELKSIGFEDEEKVIVEITEDSVEFDEEIIVEDSGLVTGLEVSEEPIDEVIDVIQLDKVHENVYEDIPKEVSELETKAGKFFEEKESKKEEFLEMIEEKNKELKHSEVKKEEAVEEKEEVIPEVFDVVDEDFEEDFEEFFEEEIIEEDFVDEVEEEIIEEDFVEEVEEETVEEEESSEDKLPIKLLKALFKDGDIQSGDDLPLPDEFDTLLDERGIEHERKMIRDFIATLNMVHVIETTKDERVALRDLDEAIDIVRIVYSPKRKKK